MPPTRLLHPARFRAVCAARCPLSFPCSPHEPQGNFASMSQNLFRFQDLQIWKKGATLSAPLFQLADHLEQRKLYRFAEQLRAATLSITNNIAEGSGSNSDTDFANFLNIARRSVFEV